MFVEKLSLIYILHIVFLILVYDDDILDMAKDNLPRGASNPYIIKFNSSSMPIIQFAVQAKESYPGLEKIMNDIVIKCECRVWVYRIIAANRSI